MVGRHGAAIHQPFGALRIGAHHLHLEGVAAGLADDAERLGRGLSGGRGVLGAQRPHRHGRQRGEAGGKSQQL